MSPENKKILSELNELIKNKSKYSDSQYLNELQKLKTKLRNLVINKTDVQYQEIKIIDAANKIINT